MKRRRRRMRILPVGHGRFAINLAAYERDLLRALPGQLVEILQSDDVSLTRLFPSAYHADPEKDAEFHRLMRDDLLEGCRGALDVLSETADLEELDEGQLVAWMRAINSLRLVMGTQLNVDEDLDLSAINDQDPDAQRYAVYGYLGFLLEHVVVALAGGIDEESR